MILMTWMFALNIQSMVGAMQINPYICGTKKIVITVNDSLPSIKDVNNFFKNKSNNIRL